MLHHIIYYVSRSTLHPDTYRVAKDNSDKRVHNDLKKLSTNMMSASREKKKFTLLRMTGFQVSFRYSLRFTNARKLSNNLKNPTQNILK